MLITLCHLPVSCRSLVDRCGSLGSCKPQITMKLSDWKQCYLWSHSRGSVYLHFTHSRCHITAWDHNSALLYACPDSSEGQYEFQTRHSCCFQYSFLSIMNREVLDRHMDKTVTNHVSNFHMIMWNYIKLEDDVFKMHNKIGHDCLNIVYRYGTRTTGKLPGCISTNETIWSVFGFP